MSNDSKLTALNYHGIESRGGKYARTSGEASDALDAPDAGRHTTQ